VDTTTLEVRTGDSFVCADLTKQIDGWLSGRGDGLCNVFVPHATAGVALFELGAGSEADIEETVSRLLPRDDRWSHRHGSSGHGADHVLPLVVASAVTLPVIAGRLAVGTWQSVVLVDANTDNAVRTVRLSFLA